MAENSTKNDLWPLIISLKPLTINVQTVECSSDSAAWINISPSCFVPWQHARLISKQKVYNKTNVSEDQCQTRLCICLYYAACYHWVELISQTNVKLFNLHHLHFRTKVTKISVVMTNSLKKLVGPKHLFIPSKGATWPAKFLQQFFVYCFKWVSLVFSWLKRKLEDQSLRSGIIHGQLWSLPSCLLLSPEQLTGYLGVLERYN